MAEEHYYPEQLKRDAQILRHDSDNPKINVLKNRFTGLEDHIFQRESSKRTNNSKKPTRGFNKI